MAVFRFALYSGCASRLFYVEVSLLVFASFTCIWVADACIRSLQQ